MRQRFGDDPETVARLDGEFLRQAGLGFMRVHPVLAALDADQDGAISASEIDHSPAALRMLDEDGDGSIIAPEVLPDPAANEATVYLSRLDANRDGRISPDERANSQGEQLRELLDQADRDENGVVSEQELANALRLRAARKQVLETAVRSAFGRGGLPEKPDTIPPTRQAGTKPSP